MEKIIILISLLFSLTVYSQIPISIIDSTGAKHWTFTDSQTKDIVKELKKSPLKDQQIKQLQKNTTLLSKSLNQCQLNQASLDSALTLSTKSNFICDSSIVLLKQSQNDLTKEIKKTKEDYEKEQKIRKTYEKVGVPAAGVLIIVIIILTLVIAH